MPDCVCISMVHKTVECVSFMCCIVDALVVYSCWWQFLPTTRHTKTTHKRCWDKPGGGLFCRRNLLAFFANLKPPSQSQPSSFSQCYASDQPIAGEDESHSQLCFRLTKPPAYDSRACVCKGGGRIGPIDGLKLFCLLLGVVQALDTWLESAHNSVYNAPASNEVCVRCAASVHSVVWCTQLHSRVCECV